MPRRRLASLGIACAFALTLVAAPAASAGPVAGKSVVGGSNAAPGQFPSTVSIKLGDGLCSGSVISPTTVLTAAHCLRQVKPSQIFVRANSNSAFGGGEVIGVTSAVKHPDFKIGFGGTANDVAILKLAAPTTAPPIAMGTTSDDALLTAPGATLRIAGFGRLRPALFKSSGAGILRTAETFVRTNCKGRSYRGFNVNSMICAAGAPYAVARSGKKRRQIQKNTCFGDSGGPILGTSATGAPVLLGVTSYGGIYPNRFGFVACGLKGFPDVYMRVSAFQSFIAQYL